MNYLEIATTFWSRRTGLASELRKRRRRAQDSERKRVARGSSKTRQTLSLLARWLRESGDADRSDQYARHAERAEKSFNARFWNAQRGCLFDVVDGPKGDDEACGRIQSLAISLPHPVLAAERWSPVLKVVEEKLLTPVGLRSLSPDDPGLPADLRWRPKEPGWSLPSGHCLALADRAFHRCVAEGASGGEGRSAPVSRALSAGADDIRHGDAGGDLRCRGATPAGAAASLRHGAWRRCCGPG